MAIVEACLTLQLHFNCQAMMLNGTDVIVSTPCTILRMMHDGYASLSRLCHLVIDDADVITREFTSEVSPSPTLY